MGLKRRQGATDTADTKANWTVVLLRGINVGGHRKLPMAELRELLRSLGCADVATYIQSGNAVYRGSGPTSEQLAAAIEGRFGFRIPVMMRRSSALHAAAAANPFLPHRDSSALHLGFLSSAPSVESVTSIEPARYAPDEFAIIDSEVYLFTPNGMANSRLSATFYKSLGVPCTVRNWRTVETLVSMTAAPNG